MDRPDGGGGRGGWYALDRLDNGGAPSAEMVVPELQDLRVGDRTRLISRIREQYPPLLTRKVLGTDSV